MMSKVDAIQSIAMINLESARHSDGYFLASLLEQCLVSLSEKGISTEQINKITGFDLAKIAANPEGWVPVSLVDDGLHKLSEYYPDTLFGLEAASSRGAGFGVLGYLAQTCATLQEVFETIIRYEALVSDIGKTSLRYEIGGLVHCIWTCKAKNKLFKRHATEFILACWLDHVRLINQPLNEVLSEVHFSHSAPENLVVLEKYHQHFGCEVKFDQADSALVVKASLMKSLLRLPNAKLQVMLNRHAEYLLGKLGNKHELVDQIKAHLRLLLLRGCASRNQLASELGISSRHLHRRLQKVGKSYSQLIDELRIEMAKTLLHDDFITIDVIAKRLGFKESTSFIRWFRQIFNMTPGDYRDQLKRDKIQVQSYAS